MGTNNLKIKVRDIMIKKHKDEPQEVTNYIKTQITTGTLTTEALEIMEDEARADTTNQIFAEFDKYKGWAIPQENLIAFIDEWGKADTEEEAKAICSKYLTLMISDKDYQVLRKSQLEKFGVSK